MLFKIEYIETNMIYLNEVLWHFISKGVESNRYQKSSLFPAEFLAVHDDERNVIDTRFRAVFDQIKKLDLIQRTRLKRMYINHQRVARLCEGDSKIVDYSGFPEGFKKPFKELGEYLYSSGLNNALIKQLAIDKFGDSNSTLYDLSIAFRKKNGQVCCFCGIQEYEEQLPEDSLSKWRPAFDHYLPKDQYPFSAVNFKNLIPCCYQCNSKAKGAEDPCSCKKTGRKKALFPYNNLETLGLKFEFIKEDIAAKSPWIVKLRDETDEKHQTWNRVFKIKDRVKSRLNANYVEWIKLECEDCLISNFDEAKNILLSKAAQHLEAAKNQRDGIHKAIMMATLAAANDDLLESILTTIKPDPSPDAREEGIGMLNDLGFNFQLTG